MHYPTHGTLPGPVVMIGFGSIAQGTLPLILRHFDVEPAHIVVVSPGGLDHLSERAAAILGEHGVTHHAAALTPANYREVLTPLLTAGPGRAFCVNLSVDTGSVDILRLTREVGALYVDTVVEPWPGFYGDADASPAARTNYALREGLLAERRRSPGGPTAISACGANPGMVSWFVKQALLDIAAAVGHGGREPADRESWARLMRDLGVKGVHIAERDTQRAATPKPLGTFVNTWSVDGFISEGLQPAELGWGTHERWLPDFAHRHADRNAPAIYLNRPGADTRVRTWCPTAGPQYGLCVTHNEAISIAAYFTLVDDGAVVYRPTCHYAYHPADDALLSWHELLGNPGNPQPMHRILDEAEIVDGVDELGVLVYGRRAAGRQVDWRREPASAAVPLLALKVWGGGPPCRGSAELLTRLRVIRANR